MPLPPLSAGCALDSGDSSELLPLLLLLLLPTRSDARFPLPRAASLCKAAAASRVKPRTLSGMGAAVSDFTPLPPPPGAGDPPLPLRRSRPDVAARRPEACSTARESGLMHWLVRARGLAGGAREAGWKWAVGGRAAT